MSVICQYCPKYQEIPTNEWDLHIIRVHPEVREYLILLAMQSTEQQVEYIYNTHPEAKEDNGILLSYLVKCNPRLRYAEKEGISTITANYKDFFIFSKRTNGITRSGRHIRQPKKTGEAIEPHESIKLSISTKEAVKRVLEAVPSARYNEGILIEMVLRHFPVPNVTMEYNKETGEVTLKAPTILFITVLRHVESISRMSRKLRSIMVFNDNSIIPERRILDEGIIRNFYAKEKG